MHLHDAKDGAEAESIGSEVQSKSATRPFLMVMHSGTCCHLHSGIVLLLGSEAQKKCYQGRLCAFDLHGCCGTNTASYILTLLKQVIQLLVSFLTSFPHSLFFPLSPPPPPPLPSQPTYTEPSNVGSLQQVSSKLHHWWHLFWPTGSLGHS